MGYTNLRPQVSGLEWFGRVRGVPRAALLVALAAGLATCNPGHGTDCLKSTGAIVTQRREVAPGLVTVTVFDNVDLRLVQDAQTYAEVRAGENLISDLEITRKGNALEIANTSSCNWARSYDSPREVTLHLPRLANLFLRGQGNVTTAGQFVQDTMFVHLIGAGDVNLALQAKQLHADEYELGDMTLRGTAEDMDFTLGGSGRLFAQGLALRNCYMHLNRDSDGDAHVRATDLVGGTVAGHGTLYYGGPPRSTDLRVSGAGRAVRE